MTGLPVGDVLFISTVSYPCSENF